MKRDGFRIESSWLLPLLAALLLALAGCASDGSDGKDGKDGKDGAPGSAFVDLTTAPEADQAGVQVVAKITGVTIASPPQVMFTYTDSSGRPLVGLEEVRQMESRLRSVRFTIAKLVPGTNGDPDSWVSYVRDEGEPDYDNTGTLVDHGDGSYTYTFATDIASVEGVAYQPSLTHRVAGQIGGGPVQVESVNLVSENFVPAGGAVSLTRDIAVVDTCNECHTKLTFHGRRFLVEYCVNCHNPDLAEGEGDMAFMTHRIHASGSFEVLDGGRDYAEVTYPQDLANCRKCHDGDDAATPDGDNWKTRPSMMACGGCHEIDFSKHAGGQTNNSACAGCHDADTIEGYHLTANATPNNPNLFEGQRDIRYEIIGVALDDDTGELTVDFRITSDGTGLDLTDLPDDLKDGDGEVLRWPVFLLAWAEAQDGIDEPADYNNLGESAAQPVDVSLGDLASGDDGTLSCTGGICTATIPGAFPEEDAMLRAVGLQGYFQQDLDGDGEDDVSLHTPSALMAVAGDEERREVVDSAKCFACHEWFEAHGGNRVIGEDGGVAICTTCHVPNLSSSGRTLDLSYPEDTQNLKDMIHGIHAADVRENPYEHVRNFRGGARFHDWSEVTFPSEDGVGNCLLCHLEGTYELPLEEGVLATTVRTTGVANGMDASTGDVATAREDVPNDTDWVNKPYSSTCYYCHDSELAVAHMEQNGGAILWNRSDVVADPALETCTLCHGSGRSAAVGLVHDLE